MAMPRRALRFVGLLGTLIAARHVAAQTEQVEEHNVSNQFTISLPEGWSVYDQSAAVLNRTDGIGLVFFSVEPITKSGELTADIELAAKMDVGQISSFFVERTLAGKKDTCEKLPKRTINAIGYRIAQDPSIGPARRLFSLKTPPSMEVAIGGCNGVKFFIDSRKDDPENHWIIDARVVSDGNFVYLFSLRHKAEYYTQTLPTFEAALATVKFVPK